MFYFARNKFIPMRILFSSSFVFKSHNGAAIFAQLFLQWAKENSHVVDVLSIEENEDFIAVSPPTSSLPILFQKQLSSSIYNRISSLDYKNYDLIYFNNVIEASESIKRLDHPRIYAFLHDSQYMNDVYPLQSFKRKLYRFFLKNIERKSIARLHKVHTNSEQMIQQINKIYNCPLEKLSYLYFTSLDLEPVVKIPHNQFTILFIKTNFLSGGLITLLDAIKTLDFPVRLITVGPTEKAIADLVTKFPSISIENHPYASRSRIKILFAESDLFVTPAFTEPMGIGNFEAMKMEVPVIGNDIEGVSEIARKSQAILLMKPNDSSDLATKISEIKNNDQLRQELILAGRKFLTEHLSKEVIFSRLTEMIET